ncbi:MAG: methionyl-tRNA formyltransferase [Clostridia bacterium]|nr:methionyl-tRNA formyltransferase [Clostridia bacterium]
MKVIFLGTPQFAQTILNDIFNSHHQVIGVVCQPDKVSNRGKTIFCPVKQFALEKGLPLYQFEKISRDGVETLQQLAPDIMVTAAYGQILSEKVISVAPFGIINVHGSLLPKLRGASPIQSAIMQGLKETGVTILKTVYEVDAGDMLLKKSLEIGENETSGELFERMATLGGQAIVEALDQIENGTATFVAQNHSEATFTKKILASQERIDWNCDAHKLHNLIRALSPNPCAWTTYNGKRVKIYSTAIYNGEFEDAPCGSVVLCDKSNLVIKAKDGALYIKKLQFEGGKCLDIKAFLCGKRFMQGEMFE